MTAIAIFAATVTLTLPAPAIPARVDYDRLLACIVQVEGHSWGEDGGAYAITRPAWFEATRQPYRNSRFSSHAYPVAIRLLEGRAAGLSAAGIAATPESLATAWRWGLTGAIRRKGKSDYGRRCQNLYNDH